jgi:putative FmdB family regulatory protein
VLTSPKKYDIYYTVNREHKMPLYEYRCKKCEKTFEVLQKIDAEPLTECMYCQGDAEKLISNSSFHFKGSGWYITDYKNKSARGETGSAADAGASEKNERTTKGYENASTNK